MSSKACEDSVLNALFATCGDLLGEIGMYNNAVQQKSNKKSKKRHSKKNRVKEVTPVQTYPIPEEPQGDLKTEEPPEYDPPCEENDYFGMFDPQILESYVDDGEHMDLDMDMDREMEELDQMIAKSKSRMTWKRIAELDNEYTMEMEKDMNTRNVEPTTGFEFDYCDVFANGVGELLDRIPLDPVVHKYAMENNL